MIAAYAAAQVDDTDFVYLDAGSSTLLMIDHLQPGATFVTNGLLHAQRLVAKGMKTYVLGGELKHSTDAIIGLAAARICITTIFPSASSAPTALPFVRDLPRRTRTRPT